MPNWLQDLTNDHVNNLVPYESARRLFAASEGQASVWMNANESPIADEYSINSELLNRYPDCQPQTVLESYAKYAKLNSEQVLITRGADEGIELLIRAFCQPAVDSILICPPTYGMYAISASTFNVGVHRVPLQSDFSLNVDHVLQHVGKVKLVFLCSPNNPTGTLLAQQDIEVILSAYAEQAIVVLDEAYIEFSCESSQQALLKKHSNLVILRTLSKGFALAGIRCGFVLSSAKIKQILLKVIAPYPVPDPVAQIASQALSAEGLANMRKRVRELNQSLKSLSKQLNGIREIELVGSQCGNFVLFRSPHNAELMQFLVTNNMLIRDQSKQLLLDKCLRISVGTPIQNKQLFELIDTFFTRLNQADSNNQEAAL